MPETQTTIADMVDAADLALADDLLQYLISCGK